MLRELFDEQRRYLNYFYDQIDLKRVEQFFDTCLPCKGLLVFTGIGKSGIIAEKIAMTLISTGTKALYLPPFNFLHGDIGIVSEEDIMILISKSGETEELLNLIPFIKRRKTKILSIVSNPNSRLAKASDLSVFLPVEKELCPFDLAPTTSTAVQLNFGDVLAIALMKAKKFSLEEYALTHPSGSIGKKMTLKVEELMIQKEELPLCHPQDLLVNLLVELSNKRSGCLLIVNDKKELLGIFTDGDLRRSLQNQGSQVLEKSIETLMNPSAMTVNKDALVWDAMKLMQGVPKRWITVLPVLENKQVIGMIRMHDIIQAGLS